MESLLSLVVKDACPQPTLYRGEKAYALLIPLSQFNVDEFEKEGPSSFLSVLRQQYPAGVCVGARKLSRNQHPEEYYAEVSFNGLPVCTKALSTPFNFKGRTINVYKALDPPAANAYSVKIYNIDSLRGQDSYKRQALLGHLSKSGSVYSLHLHYSKDGDWFTGEGCAILIAKEDLGANPLIQTLEQCKFVVKLYPFYYR